MDATLLGQYKALPTPTRYFIFNLFPSSFFFFLNRLNALYEIWKGRKKVRLKVGSNSGRSRQNVNALPSVTVTDTNLMFFIFSVDEANHTLVGGVSINSLCQQGGLFCT